MKTLTVYVGDNYFRYHELFSMHLYELKDVLSIYRRCRDTGKEELIACFKSWDYLLIEE